MTLSFPFEELVAHARAECPFYREIYADVPPDPRLTDLPVIDRTAYWDAHQRDRGNILTGPHRSGIVISSGGTTGAAKLAYYDDSDWDRGIVTTALGLETCGLQTGDRVANLFSVGEMYGSFLGTTSSLKIMRSARVLQLPISQLAPNPNIVNLMRSFGVNVLASFPTRLLRFIDYLERENVRDLPVERIIFGGESFLPAQRAAVEAFFPGVDIRSVGYASVDGGMMGVADDSCGPDEHRTANVAGIVEILDEDTHEPILEPGRTGYLVFTNLIRRFQPVLRYPAGDLAAWVEPPARDARHLTADGARYVLRGRAQQGFRLSFHSFELADLDRVLAPLAGRFGLRHWQYQLDQVGVRDRLTLRLVGRVSPVKAPAATAAVRAALIRAYDNKPDLRQMETSGVIEPVAVAWIGDDELLVNERTGKLRTVVDLRRG